MLHRPTKMQQQPYQGASYLHLSDDVLTNVIIGDASFCRVELVHVSVHAIVQFVERLRGLHECAHGTMTTTFCLVFERELQGTVVRHVKKQLWLGSLCIYFATDLIFLMETRDRAILICKPSARAQNRIHR